MKKKSSAHDTTAKPPSQNHLIVLAGILAVVLIDTLFFKESSDYVLFGIIIIYGILAYMMRISSKLTFIICLVLLGIMFVGYIFSGPSLLTEKAAVWLYLFMALGIFQQWKE